MKKLGSKQHFTISLGYYYNKIYLKINMAISKILPLGMTIIVWINSFEIIFGAIVMTYISMAEMLAVEDSERKLIKEYKVCDRNWMTGIIFT